MPSFDYMCEVCGHEGRAWREEKPPRACSRACLKKLKVNRVKGIKYPITPEIHERIKTVYQKMTGNGEVNELAKELGYPRWRLSRYALLQGWVAKTHKEPDWTEKELGILERSAHLVPERIQINLKRVGFKRSLAGIVLKRRRMRFLQNIDGSTARSVAECFGIDVHGVTRYIEKGWLKARRRGTKRTERQGGDHWLIKDQWVRDFVINHVGVIDFRKVDKYWLVDLLAGGTRGMGPISG